MLALEQPLEEGRALLADLVGHAALVLGDQAVDDLQRVRLRDLGDALARDRGQDVAPEHAILLVPAA